jgi:hypothetical protein
MGHSYTWTAATGFWSSPGNWADVTLGTNPAPTAPGAGDIVTVAGPLFPAWDLIGGPGSAASVTFTGDVALGGSFDFGVVGNASTQPGVENHNGTLDVLPGAWYRPTR